MDQNPKQQITERIKQANNVLVTVSKNPTVDQLAACIGMTLLLNKLDKHATAVFSGSVPSTLEFLQPEETLEPNTDSLRDFIISLDKSKADKLRYKVEDQVVRIFITPYKTSLSEKDLVFEQGDFNVEVILALGVHEQEDLDNAITAHGRILHDATIISVNAGAGEPGHLGGINWHEPSASSLSEMLVSMSESFGSGLIDNQMATAFLTGIVAETERFSNDKTSPKVMTMSAQLMAAGANQQLIANKLTEPEAIPEMPPEPPESEVPPPPEPQDPTALVINHVEEEPKDEIHIDDVGNFKKLDEELPPPPDELPPAQPIEAPEPPSEPTPEPSQPPPSPQEDHGHKVIQPDHQTPRLSGEEITKMAEEEGSVMPGFPSFAPANTDNEAAVDPLSGDVPSGGPTGPVIPLLGQKHDEELRKESENPTEKKSEESPKKPEPEQKPKPEKPKERINPFLEDYQNDKKEKAEKQAEKPSFTPPTSLEEARNAVKSAADDDAPLPPIAALNAQPLGPNLHNKPAEVLPVQAPELPQPVPQPAPVTSSGPTLAVPPLQPLTSPLTNSEPELPKPAEPGASPAPPPVPPPMMPPATNSATSPNTLPTPLFPSS